MSTSIKDVAQLAGVSSATVSHVINGTRYVSEVTSARVHDAIEQLQYSPNILARTLKTGRRDTVGFVVPDIANGYFATLIEEVEDALQTKGYRMIVSNTRENVTRELDSLRMLSSGVVDGIIVASTVSEFSQIEAVIPQGFPVVLVDRLVAGASVTSLTTDNTAAVHAAVEDLVRRGHYRIGLLASIPHLSTTNERVTAYRHAMNSQGITVEDSLIHILQTSTEPATDAAEVLSAQGVSAILASNNVLTNQLLAAQVAGGNVTDDIDILGYLDPTHGGIARGTPSWVEEPIGEMGRLAGEAIVRQIADPDAVPTKIVLQAIFHGGFSSKGPSMVVKH